MVAITTSLWRWNKSPGMFTFVCALLLDSYMRFEIKLFAEKNEDCYFMILWSSQNNIRDLLLSNVMVVYIISPKSNTLILHKL